ncbi:MAG TPA: hypothetical protein VN253_14235 [Kofleriaceae bacterium]|nr:hypothetical protein [Kofleriaceae bacterium]
MDQLRDLSDGTLEVLPASGTSEWLELRVGGERVFLPRSSRTPDVSTYHFGRGDVQHPTSTTNVGFELSGLSGWQQGDGLQIVSPNVGLTMVGPENGFAVYPSAGSTTISGQALDWKTAFAPIIDGAKGDTTWVTQMAAANLHYSRLTRAGLASGFTITDGRPGKLSATLAPVAQDRTLALHWKGTAFAALASEAGPAAQPAPAPAISIRALPDALARNNDFFHSFYTNLPSLVDFGPISGSADLDEAVTYGNPFSSMGAKWTELATVVYALPVSIQTPQGNGMVPAMMVSAIPVSALADKGVIAPSITPVRNAKIDGQPLDAPRSGVGSSPTLSWEAPAIGTPTSYAVVVHEVEGSKLGVSVKKAATFYTKSTSLRIPDSVAKQGGSYVFTITAIASPGADLTTRPFVGALSYASADHVTARQTL